MSLLKSLKGLYKGLDGELTVKLIPGYVRITTKLTRRRKRSDEKRRANL